jgi:plasmid stabilization system protein ParE
MEYKIELFPIAVEELEKSALWYESHSPGLGRRFINTIYEAFDSIALAPEAYAQKRARYREFVVDKFPYVIVYEIVDDMIYVLHVFHTSRNPKLKYKR